MLPCAQSIRELNEVPTEVLLQTYADRILVLVTQIGKVGNLTQAAIPPTTRIDPPPPPDPSQPNVIPLPVPPPAMQLTPLLGSPPSEHDQTLQALYVSQIATIIWAIEAEEILEPERRGIVVGLALRRNLGSEGTGLTENERSTFYSVMEMVGELARRK